MKYDTARDRCVAQGKDLCVYEYITIQPDDDYRRLVVAYLIFDCSCQWFFHYLKDLCIYENRKGYHWTNKDCAINVKVNSEGYVAVVHDAMSTYRDSIPWLVKEENTLNWFRVFWDGNGTYPGDSESNSCEANNCKSMADGR